LEVLQAAERLRWRFILTGDESWFFDYNPKGKFWLPPDVDAPQMARQVININTSKVMVTLFWNPWRVHVSNAFLSESFNEDHFVRHILHPIHSLQIVAVAHKQKKTFIRHMDNSPLHRPKVAKARLSSLPIHLARHPPYSPDLPPSDFFLFGYLKGKILGLEFESPPAFFAWINAEFQRIAREALEAIFESRIIRVQQCIGSQGDHLPEDSTTLEAICSQKASGALC
jgi:histone-lysine N-methyltransferase SETMAR